jgi:hypothetical protein
MEENFKVKLNFNLQVSLKDAYFNLQLFLHTPQPTSEQSYWKFSHLYRQQLQYYSNLLKHIMYWIVALSTIPQEHLKSIPVYSSWPCFFCTVHSFEY